MAKIRIHQRDMVCTTLIMPSQIAIWIAASNVNLLRAVVSSLRNSDETCLRQIKKSSSYQDNEMAGTLMTTDDGGAMWIGTDAIQGLPSIVRYLTDNQALQLREQKDFYDIFSHGQDSVAKAQAVREMLGARSPRVVTVEELLQIETAVQAQLKGAV